MPKLLQKAKSGSGTKHAMTTRHWPSSVLLLHLAHHQPWWTAVHPLLVWSTHFHWWWQPGWWWQTPADAWSSVSEWRWVFCSCCCCIHMYCPCKIWEVLKQASLMKGARRYLHIICVHCFFIWLFDVSHSCQCLVHSNRHLPTNIKPWT